ncbi:MAG: gliding motility protein GldC [Ignavibacteriales bacterium]|nr:MAG: gliding motility protein GldC [Ignavibacteriales bacterium]
MPKTTFINLRIQLDDNRVPEKIEWEAPDSGNESLSECKSLMLSLWDKKDSVTMGIDLWTKEMTVDEMNIHFHQTLIKMADTFQRSTKNTEASDMINDFSRKFAEKLELEKKVNKG